MATFPTTEPWRYPLQRLSRARLVVVANSSVTWSVTETEYYCDQRGIPRANIVYIPLGNGGSATTYSSIYAGGTWANVAAAVLAPIQVKARALYAQGIILGPGVPAGCQFPDASDVQRVAAMADVVCLIGYPGDSAATGDPPETYTRLNADEAVSGGHIQVRNPGFIPTQQGRRDGNWIYVFDIPAGVPTNVAAYTWPIATVIPEGAARLPLRDEEFFRSQGLPVPPASALYLGHPVYQYAITNATPGGVVARTGSAPAIPVGRVGITSLGGGGLVNPALGETQAVAREIIDRATSLMTAKVAAGARGKPILFHLTTNDAGQQTAVRWSWLRWMCEQRWGLQTRYAYFNLGGHSAETLGYSPSVSAAYTQAQLAAGSVVDFPYYLMVGGWDNVAFESAPYADAWKPLPGGTVLMGPSNGFQITNRSIARGGIGGRSDCTHATSVTVNRDITVFWNLLRGMTWLEAYFFGGNPGSMPIGDPLWAPYGQDYTYEPGDVRRRISLPPRQRAQR